MPFGPRPAFRVAGEAKRAEATALETIQGVFMRRIFLATIVAGLFLSGCSAKRDPAAERELIGSWKATSVDMSFAEGKIPEDKMGEAERAVLEENAPAFDLNTDGSARVFGGFPPCNGRWSLTKNILKVTCPNSFIRLERVGNRLTTLPDKTFTFTRQ